MRIYDTLRTAHLERLPDMCAASMIYRRPSYDFDERLAAAEGAVRLGRMGILLRVLRERPITIEVNEALQLNAWPTLMVVSVACRLIPASRRPEKVFYAIENAKVDEIFAARLRLPMRVGSLILRFFGRPLMNSAARICFGTTAAAATYVSLLGEPQVSTESRIIPALPRAADATSVRLAGRVVFVGSLETRKGILETIRAVETLVGRGVDVQLHVLGKGPLEGTVQALAADHEWLSASIKPRREEIFAELKLARVLVLFSQPTDRWREQVGLPITEGLSHGLEIVASDETGLASWLNERGHRVVGVAQPAALADAIQGALDSPRTALDVVGDLPPVDGRLAADRWLHDPARS